MLWLFAWVCVFACVYMSLVSAAFWVFVEMQTRTTYDKTIWTRCRIVYLLNCLPAKVEDLFESILCVSVFFCCCFFFLLLLFLLLRFSIYCCSYLIHLHWVRLVIETWQVSARIIFTHEISFLGFTTCFTCKINLFEVFYSAYSCHDELAKMNAEIRM